QRRGGDAGDKVEVLTPVDVPDPDAGAVVYCERRGAVRRHHRRVPPLGQRCHAGSFVGSTIVPIPSLVKISNSNACGTRPSSTCPRGTPPSTARTQASILGTMPDDRLGRRPDSVAASISLTTSLLAGQSA